MKTTWESLWPLELTSEGQRAQLGQLAVRRNWGRALLLVGWLHLLAFSFCYYLTVGLHHHEPPAYVAVWIGELVGMWGLFRICGGVRTPDTPALPLELLVRRVWIAYFVLAFNLASLNTLGGHELFELFPAMAALASFAFLMMTALVNWRFLGAVVVMFVSGLLMATHLLHAYAIFALAWWLVLNCLGLTLCLGPRRRRTAERRDRVGREATVSLRLSPETSGRGWEAEGARQRLP